MASAPEPPASHVTHRLRRRTGVAVPGRLLQERFAARALDADPARVGGGANVARPTPPGA